MARLSSEQVREQLALYIQSQDRIAHCISVAQTAQQLAIHHQLNPEHAQLAGYYHDIAKELDPASLKKLGIQDTQDKLYTSTPSIWHSFVGPDVARVQFQISEPDVLDAMRWHTTGKADMTPLSQLIFVSDFIEPFRPIPNRDYLESLAQNNLQHATLAITLLSISSLMVRRYTIHPHTFECYNYYSQTIESPVFTDMIQQLSLG